MWDLRVFHLTAEMFISVQYCYIAVFRHSNNFLEFVFSFFPMKILRRKTFEREKQVKELTSRLQLEKVSDQLCGNPCFLPV